MYEIPKQLTKYTEKFLVGTAKQDIIGIIFIFLALFVIMKFPASFTIKTIITIAVLFLGVCIILFDLDLIILERWKFRTSLKNVGYYDKLMDKFIEISEIKNDTVFLKNGSAFGVIKVKPIDFTIKSKDQQEYIIQSYRKFLKSLSFPIEITSRSIEINLDMWLYNSERKVEDCKFKNKELLLKQFSSFKKWINKEMEEGEIRDRVFYIVIPYGYEELSPAEMIKRLFTSVFKSPVKREEIKTRKIFKILSDRIEDALEKLRSTKVNAKRLNDNELLSLYSSYFTDSAEVDKNYITPVMFSKSKKEK